MFWMPCRMHGITDPDDRACAPTILPRHVVSDAATAPGVSSWLRGATATACHSIDRGFSPMSDRPIPGMSGRSARYPASAVIGG